MQTDHNQSRRVVLFRFLCIIVRFTSGWRQIYCHNDCSCLNQIISAHAQVIRVGWPEKWAPKPEDENYLGYQGHWATSELQWDST